MPRGHEVARLDVVSQSLGARVPGDAHHLVCRPRIMFVNQCNAHSEWVPSVEEPRGEGLIDHADLGSAGMIALQDFTSQSDGDAQRRDFPNVCKYGRRHRELDGHVGARERFLAIHVHPAPGFAIVIMAYIIGALGGSITSNLPSGKVELDYKPVSSTLFYGSISRGVKSGGFTAHNTTTAPAADPFEPERLTAFEVGVKSDITRTLRVDTSVFYYRYRDQQILGKVFDDASQSFIGRFVNANSRINGGEMDLEWRPLTGIVITQYAGFAEGYYTSKLLDVPLNPAQPPVDYNGQPESFPKWSYGGDVSYTWNVGAFSVTAESNYSFHDTYSQFFLLGSNDFTIPKYWLANANLTLAPASGAPWTVTLWGRNIFDKSYDLTRNFFLPTSEVAAAGEPTTVGIRLTYKY